MNKNKQGEDRRNPPDYPKTKKHHKNEKPVKNWKEKYLWIVMDFFIFFQVKKGQTQKLKKHTSSSLWQ